MKLSLAMTMSLGLWLTGSAAHADDAVFSKQDVKLILEYAKLPNHAIQGVDVETGEVKATNNVKSTMQAANEWIAAGAADPTGDINDYARFAKSCGVKPKVVFDMAVILFNPSKYAFESFWRGFNDTCSNPPDPVKTAFIRQFKTVHFVLGGLKAKPLGDTNEIPWAFARFNSKTGEMVIGYAPEGAQNLPEGIKRWVGLQ